MLRFKLFSILIDYILLAIFRLEREECLKLVPSKLVRLAGLSQKHGRFRFGEKGV